MVLDESLEVALLNVSLMVVESCLVSDLVGNELGVVSGEQGLVDALFLVWVLHHVGVHELSHLDVVGEQVDWQVDSFGDGNELFVLNVLLVFVLVELDLLVGITSSPESSDWGDPLAELVVHLQVFNSESGVLLVEEFSKAEGLSV